MTKYEVPMVAYFTVTVYADDPREADRKAEGELDLELGNAPLRFRDDMRYQFCEKDKEDAIKEVVDRDEEEDWDWDWMGNLVRYPREEER